MNTLKNMAAIFLILILSSQAILHAQTLYVTDKVLLGVHKEPKEESLLITSIPSGTAVEVLERKNTFTKIKQANGTQGWVNTQYLIKDIPAILKLKQLNSQFKDIEKKNTVTLETLKNSIGILKKDLRKKERELQLHQDELANSRTALKELTRKYSHQNQGTINTEINNELEESQKKIEALQKDILKLKSQTTAQQADPDTDAILKNLEKLEQQNHMLETRIDVAQANLSGEKIPTAEELAFIRPKFPSWYWGLLAVMVIIGFIAGLFALDHLYRKRHGGFRL